MPRVSQWFFAVAVLCAIFGMVWGLHMAATNDHSQFPAHAHLNLIGWVGSAIYGTFFALSPGRFQKNAWIVFILNTAGVAIMAPSLGLLLASGDDPASPYVIPTVIGSVLTLLAMLAFAVAVFRRIFGPQT